MATPTGSDAARETDAAESAALPSAASAVEFLLQFTRASHGAGYPTADLEERIVALGEALGLSGTQVSATPTVIEVSVGSPPGQTTYSLRVRPTAVDLGAIARLDELAGTVFDSRIDTTGALAALEAIRANPIDRPWPVTLAAYAAAGAALTPILGGGWREAAGAALVGLVVGSVAVSTRRTARTEPMVAPVAAIVASFCAAGLHRLGLEASPDVVTLAALVTLLPGMTLTIGMRELATEHLQSGVANTASALFQLLGLVFGVGIGRSIATSWFGDAGALAPSTASVGVELLAALAAGLAFTLTLRAQSRDAVVMSAATVLALGSNELGTAVFGADASVFVAALVVGITGGLVGSLLRRSPLVFIVPGVLMLVPGSAGFNSALHLLTDQTVTGIAAAFDTFVTAMSIAYGLMVSTIVLPRRVRQVVP